MQVLQAQLEIGCDPAEVGRARRWARTRLARSGVSMDGPMAEKLILLISELVTNAVVHTGHPAVLCLRLPTRPDAQESATQGAGQGVGHGAGEEEGDGTGLGTVRVEVADASEQPPRRRRALGGDTGGRGLELVDGLADRWGWQPEGVGKRIWCEVDPLEAAGSARTSSRVPSTDLADRADRAESRTESRGTARAALAGAYSISCVRTIRA